METPNRDKRYRVTVWNNEGASREMHMRFDSIAQAKWSVEKTWDTKRMRVVIDDVQNLKRVRVKESGRKTYKSASESIFY